MKCINCKFIELHPSEEIGLCRRYPPNLKSIHTAHTQPLVEFDDWCGEYKPKGDRQ